MIDYMTIACRSDEARERLLKLQLAAIDRGFTPEVRTETPPFTLDQIVREIGTARAEMYVKLENSRA